MPLSVSASKQLYTVANEIEGMFFFARKNTSVAVG
jgi:hypothetical protein